VPTNLRIIRSYDHKVNGACVVKVSIARRVLPWVLLWLVVMSLFVGCRGRESRAQALYDEAQEHIERSEFVDAVRLYEEILDKYPGTKVSDKAGKEISLYRGLSLAVDTYPVRRVKDQMIQTGRAVYRYEDQRRRWPKSLGELVPKYLPEAPIDPWGRELVYLVKPRRRGYVLGCYGADGRPGGEGEARDWYIEDGRFVRQPSVALP
jgi:hypothetical protein